MCRNGILASILSLIASAASAIPIEYTGGYLDGTLRVYEVTDDDFMAPYDLVLLHDFDLGTDFYPAVPTSFLQNGTPYSWCTHGAANLSLLTNSPECLGFVFPLSTAPFGDPITVASLSDGCSNVLVSVGSNAPEPTPVL